MRHQVVLPEAGAASILCHSPTLYWWNNEQDDLVDNHLNSSCHCPYEGCSGKNLHVMVGTKSPSMMSGMRPPQRVPMDYGLMGATLIVHTSLIPLLDQSQGDIPS